MKQNLIGQQFLNEFGFPKIWQFLMIDSWPYLESTNHNDVGDFISVSPKFNSLQEFLVKFEYFLESNQIKLDDYFSNFPKDEYAPNVNQSGPVPRILSRAMTLMRVKHIAAEVEKRFQLIENCSQKEKSTLTSSLFGDQPSSLVNSETKVVLVSSSAGSYGSSSFLDIADLVTLVSGSRGARSRLLGILYADDIFDPSYFTFNSSMRMNSFQSTQEILHAHLNPDDKKRANLVATLLRLGDYLDVAEAFGNSRNFTIIHGDVKEQAGIRHTRTFESTASFLARAITSLKEPEIEDLIATNLD